MLELRIDSQASLAILPANPGAAAVSQSVNVWMYADIAHYWPDDPLIAEPTARAKPRKTT